MVAGDRAGFLTLFLESGSGLTNAGHIRRDSGATQVDVRADSNSFPFINDWNQDGKKDLIVGEEAYPQIPGNGSIRIFLNTGTNAAPRFGNYSYVLAGGSPLYIYRVNPVIYDLDRDNIKDLIVGNNDGNVYFYKNVGTNAAPLFNVARETLRTVGGAVINAYFGSRINFVDWRGDGDIDMLISGYYGYVELYENGTVEIETGEEKGLVTNNLKVSPNPAMNRAVISYSLVNRSQVELKVYSSDGRLVATPFRRHEEAGSRQLVWNIGNDLPAGVYILRLKTDDVTNTARIVIAH